MTTADPNASVTATVVDGSSLLTLDLKGFQAGDKLVFTIDVDEVQQFDPSETDPGRINDGFDPITSGVEFQGSKLKTYFAAPHYHNISGTGEFRNRYDDLLVGTGLDLPADNEGGKRDRSTGTALSLVQQPLPVSIAGNVYLETDLDLVRDPGENGIANVTLALWQKQGKRVRFHRSHDQDGGGWQLSIRHRIGSAPRNVPGTGNAARRFVQRRSNSRNSRFGQDRLDVSQRSQRTDGNHHPAGGPACGEI